jgi:hypothetical protein
MGTEYGVRVRDNLGQIDYLPLSSFAGGVPNIGQPILPGGSIIADGFLWTNNTASVIIVPNPDSVANMLGNGFTRGIQTSAAITTRYTTNGLIADQDHTAILDGVTAMTISTATLNRRIDIYNAGNAPVSIVDTSGAEFIVTNPANPIFTQTSTDSTIIINQSHRNGALIYDGVAWEFTR